MGTLRKIVDAYETLLLDAYGVLLNYDRALPYACGFISFLQKQRKNFYILTNGASSTVSASAANYQSKGLNISAEQVISSGSLLLPWLVEHKLEKEKFYLLGPKESRDLLPGIKVTSGYDEEFSGLIISNQNGFALQKRVNWLITTLVKKIKNNEKLYLILPNPDLIFPAKNQMLQITSGMIALIIENALESCFGVKAPKFTRLGKPYSPIFAEAYKKTNSRSMVLFGDQLQTDILGAKNFGIDSVLVGTGLVDLTNLSPEQRMLPTYILQDLRL